MSENKVMFTVEYKPTGKTFAGDPPIKKGRHGRYETIEEAEEGVKACKRWFNERVTQARKLNDVGVELMPEVRIFGDHIIVWINEWLYEWDEDKERPKRGVLTKSGEPKCVESSETSACLENQESESQSTKSTGESSPRKSGTKRSQQSSLALAQD